MCIVFIFADSTTPVSSSERTDIPTSPVVGIEDAAAPTSGDDDLSGGAVTGIVLAILAVLCAGGVAMKLKCGSIHCCQQQNNTSHTSIVSDSNISGSNVGSGSNTVS